LEVDAVVGAELPVRRELQRAIEVKTMHAPASARNRAQCPMGIVCARRRALHHLRYRQDGLARKLAEVAADGGTNGIAPAALGLTEVAGMLLELYAECAGVPIDTAFLEATVAFRDPGMEIRDA
jgi:hypothetical protein